MKKLLFAIAICGFVFTSCGNKTKTASTEEKACCSKEKTEVVAEKEEGCKSDCSKGCTHIAKPECTKDAATAETKTECCKGHKAEETTATIETKKECKGDCAKDCSKKS